MPDERAPADDERKDLEEVSSEESGDEFDEGPDENRRRWYEDRNVEEEVVNADPNELVTIATFSSPYDAEMARLHLHELNMPTSISGMPRIWGTEDIQLQVRRSDAKAALEALEAKASSTTGQPEEIESDTALCLSCGQHFPEDATACPACGWSYADDQETRFRADS